jgi:hypothetical protein
MTVTRDRLGLNRPSWWKEHTISQYLHPEHSDESTNSLFIRTPIPLRRFYDL